MSKNKNIRTDKKLSNSKQKRMIKIINNDFLPNRKKMRYYQEQKLYPINEDIPIYKTSDY